MPMTTSNTDPLADLASHRDDVQDAYDRRAAAIQRAWRAGYSTRAIAEALGMTPRAIEQFMGRRVREASL